MNRTATRRDAPPFTVIACITIGVLVAFGVYLKFVDSSPLGIDAWWEAIASVTHGSAPYSVAVFFAQAGSAAGSGVLALLAAVLLFMKRRPRDAGAVVTTLVLGVMCSEVIKWFVMRPRPDEALYPTHGSSYPSGHSMGAAALAVSIALVFAYADGVRTRTRSLVWIAAAAWVMCMMWSRAALHAHWLSDTIAGALLGASAAILARRLWADRRVLPDPVDPQTSDIQLSE